MTTPKPPQDIQERAKALEDEFFRRQDEAALEKLRAAREHAEAVDGLKEVAGIDDATVIEALLEAGVDASTHSALALVPLAATAWASGRVEDREREAVLRAAADAGLSAGTAGRAFLEGLLEKPVDDELLAAWEAYTAVLGESLGDTRRRALGLGIVRWARTISEAAGGFLGLNTVSIAEREMLERIERAFGLEQG